MESFLKALCIITRKNEAELDDTQMLNQNDDLKAGQLDQGRALWK
jgi:hypothetical protein